MTIKELSQLYWLNREIERDKARLEELYTKAASCTQTITGMPHVPGITDKVGKYAGEIADLRGIIEANIQRCFYELNRLNRYIDSVDDPQMRMILSLRFVNGLPWRQVAESIGGGNTEDSVRMMCKRYIDKM
jgi:hypothetical protein